VIIIFYSNIFTTIVSYDYQAVGVFHHCYNALESCCKISIATCSVHCAADDFDDHCHKGLIHITLYRVARGHCRNFAIDKKIGTFDRYFRKTTSHVGISETMIFVYNILLYIFITSDAVNGFFF